MGEYVAQETSVNWVKPFLRESEGFIKHFCTTKGIVVLISDV